MSQMIVCDACGRECANNFVRYERHLPINLTQCVGVIDLCLPSNGAEVGCANWVRPSLEWIARQAGRPRDFETMVKLESNQGSRPA